MAIQDTLDYADLKDETLISYRSQTRPHDELDMAMRRRGISFSPQIEIDSSISAAGFVRAGLGVALVDALLPWEQFPGILTRPLSDTPSLPVSLLVSRDRSLSRAEVAMRKLLHATPVTEA